MSMPQASYMKESISLKRARKTLKPTIAMLLVAFIAFSASVLTMLSPTDSSGGQTANAAIIGIVCGDENELGNYMNQGSWDPGMGGFPHSEASSRFWTMQEAFGNNVNFPNYHGEGKAEDKWIVKGVKEDRGKAVSEKGWTDNKSKFEEIRTTTTCVLSAGANFLSNVGLSLAGGISKIAQIFAVFAFDSNIICPEAGAGTGCIDLLKIIGGTSTSGASSQGLIGTLTSGIYIPLLVIVVAISGLWVGYRGLVQRKYREAMFGAIWIMCSVIFGLTLLYKPAVLAKAPMAVSNTITACVIGGFTGNSCWDGGGAGSASVPADTLDSKKICISRASGLDITEEMSMSVNGLSCSIWEAFVLEPYAQGSFGRSVDELNVNDPVVSAAISKAGLNKNDFCVELKSNSSVNNMPAKLKLDGGGNKVCNLAVYQAYLSTNADAGDGGTKITASTPDTRWYKLIFTVASDPGMWEKWSPDGAAGRMGVGMLASFSAVLGSVVIIIISLFALMYYIIAVIMIVFAPLFFLVGVHPGRGRSILIGWAEIILSNVLKYMASAFFLIVTIAFYAAVLGAAGNIALTMLFVLVLSGALLLYRKEIVDLMGKVNMGGERLSNTMGEKLGKMGDRVGKAGVAVAGSTAGAVISTKPANYFKEAGSVFTNVRNEGLMGGLKHTVKSVGDEMSKDANVIKAGAKDGLKRELKKGNGLVSNATRTYDRISQDNKRDLATEAKTARGKANSEKASLTAVDKELHNLQNAHQEQGTIASRLDVNYKQAEETENSRREIDAKISTDLSSMGPEMQQMQMLLNRLYELKSQHSVARATGNTAQMLKLDQEIAATEGTARHLIANDPNGTLNMYGAAYQNLRNERFKDAGVSAEDVAAGRISATAAQAGRDQITQGLDAEFTSVAPLFSQLEGSLQRLDSLRAEKEIALRAGDTARAESFTPEITRLEGSVATIRRSMSAENETELTGQLNKLKDNRYREAGLDVNTENAAAKREAFIELAANRDSAIRDYKNTAERYAETVKQYNDIAAVAAENDAKAGVLEKAVTDMLPGDSLDADSMKKIRRDVNTAIKDATPSPETMDPLMKIDGVSNRITPDYTGPVYKNIDPDGPNGGGGVPPSGPPNTPPPGGGGGGLPISPRPVVDDSRSLPGPAPAAPQQTALPPNSPQAGPSATSQVVPQAAPAVQPQPAPAQQSATPVENKAQQRVEAAPAASPIEGVVLPASGTPTVRTETPQATTPVTSRAETVREVVKEVPQQGVPQSAPEPKVVKETVIKESNAPSVAPVSAPSSHQEAPRAQYRNEPAPPVQENVREVIREVQTSSAPEVREIIKEVPGAPQQVRMETPATVAQPVEVREVIREVQTPAPAAPAAEVREVIREVQTPAEPVAPQTIRETVVERQGVPVTEPQVIRETIVQQAESSTNSRNMSDDEVRALLREQGEALSARERATFEETLRTAKAAQPSASGSNDSMLQRAAETARQERDTLVAKMMAAQNESDAKHAAERARFEAQLSSAQQSAADAQRAASVASNEAARRSGGIPTSPPTTNESRSSQESRDRDSNDNRGNSEASVDRSSNSAQSSNTSNDKDERSQTQNMTSSSDNEVNVKEDKPDAPKSRFGRSKPADKKDKGIDFTQLPKLPRR